MYWYIFFQNYHIKLTSSVGIWARLSGIFIEFQSAKKTMIIEDESEFRKKKSRSRHKKGFKKDADESTHLFLFPCIAQCFNLLQSCTIILLLAHAFHFLVYLGTNTILKNI